MSPAVPIPVSNFAGRVVAVLGLARSGLAAALALAAGGAEVWAWDDSEAARALAAEAGVAATNLYESDWSRAAALVLSPGIPHTYPRPHALAQKARAAGCPIIGDIDLLMRARPQANYVGVTGTNGKSTTTSLIGHILAGAGRQVAVGGNLGQAALTLAPLGADGIYVLEMSSYQLELTPSASFKVAILLNITPDHLDRHGGFDGYVAAKRRIFDGQKPGGTAIIGADDDASAGVWRALIGEHGRRVVPISARRAVPGGVYAESNRLIDATLEPARTVMDFGRAERLPGEHNRQNAAAAWAASRALDVPASDIAAGISSYPGLSHRQELVADVAGVRFINDSKATNADAAAKALACYDAIYWIAGGRPKESGIAGLEAYYPRIRHAFLIGEAAEAFAKTLDGHVGWTLSRTLGPAVEAAAAMAAREGRRGAVVLLSPAAASFDQYANFEERGSHFRRLVEGGPALAAPRSAS